MFGAFVLGRALVGVVLDDPDAAALVHGDAGGGDEVGFLGDQLYGEARVGGDGRGGGRGRNARGDNSHNQGRTAWHHDDLPGTEDTQGKALSDIFRSFGLIDQRDILFPEFTVKGLR